MNELFSGAPLSDGGRLLLAAVGLLSLGWLAAILRSRQRSQSLQRTLLAGVRSAVEDQGVNGPRAWAGSFAWALSDPPEPFARLYVTYRTPSAFNLPGLLLPRGPASPHLYLAGKLNSALGSELIWLRGRVAGEAVGRSASQSLWVRRQLDVTRSEYVTRGANTSALQRALADLITRFGRHMQEVRVQQPRISSRASQRPPQRHSMNRREPEIRLALRAHALSAETLPALIITLRALGRAALR